MRTLGWVFISCLTIQVPPTCSADENTYHNSVVGFTITKPASWYFEMQAAESLIRYYETQTKLVVITRNPEPFSDLNASLAIFYIPQSETPVTVPKTLVRIAISKMVDRFENAVVREGPTDVTIQGHQGAYARISFDSLAVAGRRTPASHEIWAIASADLFYIIEAVSRQDEKTGSRQELHQIIETIQVGTPTTAPATQNTPSPR